MSKDNDKLNEMRKKSTSGSIGKKTGHKMNITREEYLKRFVATVSLTATIAAIAIGGGKVLADKISDSVTAGSTKHEYYKDLVQDPEKPNWYPTDNGGGYYYDEGGIASDLKSLNQENPYGYEFDVGVASLIEYIGSEETDSVLNYTDYNGLDNYLEQKGYEDIESFQKDIDKQIVIKTEINEKQQELNEMRNEIDSTEVAQTNESEMTGGSK